MTELGLNQQAAAGVQEVEDEEVKVLKQRTQELQEKARGVVGSACQGGHALPVVPSGPFPTVSLLVWLD